MLEQPLNHRIPWQLFKGWLSTKDTACWISRMQNDLTWEQPSVNVYGKIYPVPRLSCFLADSNITYKYSGFVHNGHGWPDWFYPLLDQVNDKCGTRFNLSLIHI